MEDEITLKVGDSVYISDDPYYTISTVERLTPTMAVLSNEINVYNKLISKWGLTGFLQGNYKWNLYCIITDEILEKKKNIEYIRIVKRWFETYEFTLQDKKFMYEKFKELGKI